MKNNTDDFLIVYSSFTNNASNIYARTYMNAAIFQVNQDKSKQAFNPRVAVFQDNTFLVIWTCLLDNDMKEICARLCSLNGCEQEQFFSNQNYSNPNITQNKSNASMAINQYGNVIITWVSIYDFTSSPVVEGCTYKYDSTQKSLNMTAIVFPIYNASKDTSFLSYPKISIGNNNLNPICVIVWEELNENDNNFNVKTQFIDIMGNKISNYFTVNSASLLDHLNPDVNITENLVFIVWQSYGLDGNGFGIYGRTFDHYGNNVNDEWRINQKYYEGDQVFPKIFYKKNQKFMYIG